MNKIIPKSGASLTLKQQSFKHTHINILSVIKKFFANLLGEL